MHSSSIDNLREGEHVRRRHRFDRSWHLWATLPDNPVCWLLGHTPRVGVQESRYISPYVRIDCRVCGRRYNWPYGPPKGQDQREHMARRVEVARRDPDMVRRSVAEDDRRDNWPHTGMELGAQVVVPRRPRPEVSLRFHLGGLGSETPVDAHASIGGFGVYVNTSLFGRVAEALTRGQGRELTLRVQDGHAYWKAWTSEDGHPLHHHRRWSKYRSWACRDGNLSLRPLDYLHGGPRKYHREPIDKTRTVLVRTNEGTEHVVDMTLCRGTIARPHGPVLSTSLEARWECKEGIPVRNHEWKGDEVYASSVTLPDYTPLDPPGAWLPFAMDALRANITRDRRHHEWVPDTEAAEA